MRQSWKCSVLSGQLSGAFLGLLIPATAGFGADFAGICGDRAAIERIYYNHRLGTKPLFDQTLPPMQLEAMAKLDLKKEAVLKRVYKISLNEADVAAEVQRIDATTRAPEILAEIKTALGNDPKRFADAVARPILVERKLHAQFADDAKLHAPRRAEAEQTRKRILARRETNERIAVLKENKNASEVTWQLTPGTGAAAGGVNLGAPPVAPMKIITSSQNYSIEATAQVAQALHSPEREKETKSYFEDLGPELQKVLRVQLQKAGSVSAVIETPGAFLLFIAKKKTRNTLSVASLSIPKRSYDEWLAQEPD